MATFEADTGCAQAEVGPLKPDLPKEDGELVALRKGLAQFPKQIPCSFLYDDRGSDLYNQITELEEYYPYKTEIQMLQLHASDIINQVPKGAKVVELGCGSATKTSVLLRELLRRDGKEGCAFIGIDVSADFLDQAKDNLLNACPGLMADKVEMIQASYLEGLREARHRHPHDVLCILWLGSSIGNLDRQESQAFFKDIIRISGSKTQILVCTDLWKDRSVLHRAYCDSKGVTEAFIKNGFRNAIQAVSDNQVHVDLAKWKYDVVVNPDTRQVEMYVIAGQSLCINGKIGFQKGERILMEVSRKFLPDQLRPLAFQAGFIFQAQWKNELYSMQMLGAPEVAFHIIWRDTDRLFSLVKDWCAVPISLRHPFCFYYGHLAGFAKLKLFEDMSPSKLDIMFSRGIDPDVSNPTQCHSHPDIPKSWPTKTEIIQYTHQAREMIQEYCRKPNHSMRNINLALEHECMHQETLCYMLAQSQKHLWERAHLDDNRKLIPQKYLSEAQNGTNGHPANGHAANDKQTEGKSKKPRLEPTTTDKPEDRQNGVKAGDIEFALKQNGMPSDGYSTDGSHDSWTCVPGGPVVLGVEINSEKAFNWDNEGPIQAPQVVQEFKVANKAVTVEAFRQFVLEGGYKKRDLWSEEGFACVAAKHGAPATWTVTAGKEIYIHSPEGTCHWEEVKNKPVLCSLAEAQAYCKARGCRLLKELEYLRAVEFDPSGKRIEGLACNGWELLSTLMEPLEGFKPMENYPEYSSDFYDGKHFVLRGSSSHTPHAVIRSDFRNFYQDVYPFHFAKFRCCAL